MAVKTLIYQTFAKFQGKIDNGKSKKQFETW